MNSLVRKMLKTILRRGGILVQLLVIFGLLTLYLFAKETSYKFDDSLLLALFILASLWIGYVHITVFLKNYFRKNAFKPEDAHQFLLFWRYGWLGAGILFALISLSGSMGTLGISAAFVGMILGWSLQAPVTGIAAWIMVMVKRPFSIGDRIIVSGITGDVMDITMTHIVLNQVGGTVAGEERSGRGVLIPNATLFNPTIHNYTYETKFVLDEVVVLTTFRSNFNLAKQILLSAAEEATQGIIQETGTKPYTRVEISPEHGIRIRIRFQTNATDRQRISSEITEKIIEEFGKHYNQVEFSFPHTEVIYRPKYHDQGEPSTPA